VRKAGVFTPAALHFSRPWWGRYHCHRFARNHREAPTVDRQSIPLADLPGDLIPITGAAQRLGVHANALHRARLAGKLPCYKVLGRWKVSAADLELVLARSVPPGAAPAPESPAERCRRQAGVDARLRARGHKV
jgi:hypothetical protein